MKDSAYMKLLPSDQNLKNSLITPGTTLRRKSIKYQKIRNFFAKKITDRKLDAIHPGP